MITILNAQRTTPLDEAAIRDAIARMLTYLGYAEYDVGVWFTTDRTIRKYNKQYRGKDKATDILSFPFDTNAADGEKILGDLIISVPYVSRAARELDISFYMHLRRLLAHGLCHLLGYTHDTDEQYQTMHAQEQKLLALFGQSIDAL